ncbi:MAG TPA: DinB family protein [Thermomicrobiales bacterium]|nr:DinB family protein [Thermomicrobiales bacterium]
MSGRSDALAERFEAAVEEFIGVVEPLTDEQWRTVCPNEERSIGVLARHGAQFIPFELSYFQAFAAGRQPSMIDRNQLAEWNANHAIEWAQAPQDETLELLRERAAHAASEVLQMTDEQLAMSGRYTKEIEEPWTVEKWLDRVLIGHVFVHLQSIRETLASEGAD